MEKNQLWFAGAAIVAAFLFTASKPIFADTFQIFDLGIAESHSPYGIDIFGTVVIQVPNAPPPFDVTYQTWVNGVHVSDSFTPPSLSYDNGTSCVPTVNPPLIAAGLSKCNNGHEVFAAEVSGSTGHHIYTGPNLSDVLVVPFFNFGALDALDLNAAGDFVWVDGGAEEIFEAIDLTTDVPEPATIALLSTGLLAMVGAARRRLFR